MSKASSTVQTHNKATARKSARRARYAKLQAGPIVVGLAAAAILGWLGWNAWQSAQTPAAPRPVAIVTNAPVVGQP
ncbi:MAG: hypothetical protein HZB20_10650, partial [Chloroflexi bacterium]|nr:hypothetical protein [Chloroflexota bacterium]